MTIYRHSPSGLARNTRYRVDTASGSVSAATIQTPNTDTTISGSIVGSDLLGRLVFEGSAATLYLKELGYKDVATGTVITSTGAVSADVAPPSAPGGGLDPATAAATYAAKTGATVTGAWDFTGATVTGVGGAVTDGSITPAKLSFDPATQAELDAAAAAALPVTARAAALGVASLDSGSKVPTGQLGTGTADATKVLAGDRAWVSAVPLALAGQTPAQEPVALGAVGVGTGGAGARMDHVHPTTGLALTTDLAGLVPARRKSGFYYATSATGTANIAISGNQLYAAPWLAPHNLSVDRLACHVDTVGSAGALIRLGIYADDGNGWPGALVLDAGTMAGDSGTGLKTITVSQALPRGEYHLAIALQGSPATLPKFRGTTSGHNFLLMGGIDLATLGMWTGTNNACTGAFPSTAEQPAGSATGNLNSVVLGARIV